MAADREALPARVTRYREKAAELRERIKRSPALKQDFLKLAQEYEDMADQLEAIANDFR